MSSIKNNINKNIKFIFITGGVTSSLGKGLLNASLGRMLISINKNFKIKFIKCDPYLNIDPGTMNPNQHGEVYVLNDGAETDLDFGHYERFTDLYMNKNSSITAGKIYSSILEKERKGLFLGKTVQTIPHVTNEIKSAIYKNIEEDTDFILCEIGGTVGDMEALPFLEAIRQIGYEYKEQAMYIHMTFVPYLKSAKELKTKPTQHSTSTLRSIGIQPDVLICRAEHHIPIEHREKIANFCNLTSDHVIPLIDTENVYDIPLSLHKYHLDNIICDHFNLEKPSDDYLGRWDLMIKKMKDRKFKIKIGIIGKYADVDDSYKSLYEAIHHAGIQNDCYVDAHIVDSRGITNENVKESIEKFDGIIIAGGFGLSGIDGKIQAIKFARENNIPLFGICLGMQLALIEVAQNLLHLECANSTELDQDCKDPIIWKMEEWIKNGEKELRANNENIGGTMRLGAYQCNLKNDSLAEKMYCEKVISERHRHRYEFNNKYKSALESVGVVFSGISADNDLVEIMEIPSHPWFLAVQFHPEFQSSILHSHPLFSGFVKFLIERKSTLNIKNTEGVYIFNDKIDLNLSI